jgi:hypothetical protein
MELTQDLELENWEVLNLYVLLLQQLFVWGCLAGARLAFNLNNKHFLNWDLYPARVTGPAWSDMISPLRVRQHRTPRWAQSNPCHPSFWPSDSPLPTISGISFPLLQRTPHSSSHTKVCVSSKHCIIQQEKNNSNHFLKCYTECLVLCREFAPRKINCCVLDWILLLVNYKQENIL